jgi:hypothetical protein
MSRDNYLYIGPYAEWLVPTEPELFTEGVDSVFPEVPYGGPLEWNPDINGTLTVEMDGKWFHRCCCMPAEERAGRPEREMRFAWHCIEGEVPPFVATEWGAVDRQAELAWFRTAFADELRQWAKQIGSEPTFHWGAVHWYAVA